MEGDNVDAEIRDCRKIQKALNVFITLAVQAGMKKNKLEKITSYEQSYKLSLPILRSLGGVGGGILLQDVGIQELLDKHAKVKFETDVGDFENVSNILRIMGRILCNHENLATLNELKHPYWTIKTLRSGKNGYFITEDVYELIEGLCFEDDEDEDEEEDDGEEEDEFEEFNYQYPPSASSSGVGKVAGPSASSSVPSVSPPVTKGPEVSSHRSSTHPVEHPEKKVQYKDLTQSTQDEKVPPHPHPLKTQTPHQTSVAPVPSASSSSDPQNVSVQTHIPSNLEVNNDAVGNGKEQKEDTEQNQKRRRRPLKLGDYLEKSSQ